MNTRYPLLLTVGLFGAGALAQDTPDAAYLSFLQARGDTPWINAGAEHPLAETAYRPIPPLSTFASDPAKHDLGFALFHDPELSADGTVGCNTCHMGMRGATDGKAVATGIGGAAGTRNTPTVFNAAFNFRQFWDGRSFDLNEQSLAPITDPVEMGHNLTAVVARLKADSQYADMFAKVYPDGVTEANLGNAIAQHTKDMTRTDSPFNNWLSGDSGAMSAQALQGRERFNALGCVSCHNGINLGGNSYQQLGSATPVAMADPGLYRRTQRDQDRQVFKVPQLHNVAITAPYYHDGSVATLDEAVRRMGREQAGRTLAEQDVADIVVFLESLSSAFFRGRAPGLSSAQLQSEMRQQMPDTMNHAHGADMPEDEHARHMMQMQHHNPASQGSH